MRVRRKHKPHSDSATKFRGYLVWLIMTGEDEGMYERFETNRAVLRDDSEFALDFDAGSPATSSLLYTVILRREDSLVFRGEWSVGKSAERETGTCSCRCYRNGDHLALAGTWKQAGHAEPWFGEFTAVESFAEVDKN
jgi:hypothetical protein